MNRLQGPKEQALVPFVPFNDLRDLINAIVDDATCSTLDKVVRFFNLNMDSLSRRSWGAITALVNEIDTEVSVAVAAGRKKTGQKGAVRRLLADEPPLRRCLKVIIEERLREILGTRASSPSDEDAAIRKAAQEIVRAMEDGSDVPGMRGRVKEIMTKHGRTIGRVRDAVRDEISGTSGHPGIEPDRDIDFRSMVCTEGKSIASGIGELKTTDADTFDGLKAKGERDLKEFLARLPKVSVEKK